MKPFVATNGITVDSTQKKGRPVTACIENLCVVTYLVAYFSEFLLGCRDKEGNSYDVWQSWNPNPLFKCTCTPNLKVECQKTESGCWDSHGNAFVDGHEWLSNNMTKCTCSYGKITCTKLSRPACTDEKGMVREHGTHWFSGVCFNCSCVDGLISCAKYRVTIKYGLFQVETIGRCIPCHQPSNDILPTGDGTVAACQGGCQ